MYHKGVWYKKVLLRSFFKAEVVQRGVIMCNKDIWRKDLAGLPVVPVKNTARPAQIKTNHQKVDT